MNELNEFNRFKKRLIQPVQSLQPIQPLKPFQPVQPIQPLQPFQPSPIYKEQKMKILHINSHDNGGAAIAAIRLHKAMLKSDIDSKILLRYKTNYTIPFSYQYTPPPKNILSRILNRFNSGKTETRLDLKYKLKRHFSLLNRNDCKISHLPIYKEADIIIFHSISNFIALESFLSENTKPIIWTLHDMNSFTGGCHYSESCTKFTESCNNCPILKDTEDRNIAETELYKKINLFAKQNIQIVSPSLWLKQYSEQSSCFRSFNHYLIPYSLDTSVFRFYNKKSARDVLNLPSDKKILLFICDNIVDKRKGFDLLVNALDSVDKSKIHVCVAGNNFDANLNIPDLSYFGKIHDEFKMALLYASSDVFILPSREDNLPNVMLESLCVGTPVIGFSIGGLKDILKTGYNGVLIDNISSTDLADAITNFINDNWAFDNKNISEVYTDFFSQEKQVKSYMDTIKL